MKSIKESIIGKRGSIRDLTPKDLRLGDIVQLENREYRMIAADYLNGTNKLCLCYIPSRGTYNLKWHMLSTYGDSMDISHKPGWGGNSIIRVFRTDIPRYSKWASDKFKYEGRFEEGFLQVYAFSKDYKIIWEAK